MLLLKCKISRGMISGERICSFVVGDMAWDTCQSAWMCYRASDMVQAADIPETESYDGLAKIWDAGGSPVTGKAWVRYWFAHQTESKSGLDLAALQQQIINTGSNDD